MENKVDNISEMDELKKILKQQNKPDKLSQLVLLYGSVATVILSKSLFSKNLDIKIFLENSGIYLKDYVYSSRTQIIARLIRIIQNSTFEENMRLLNSIKEIISQGEQKKQGEKPKPKTEKVSKKNTVDQLLTQFGRRD